MTKETEVNLFDISDDFDTSHVLIKEKKTDIDYSDDGYFPPRDGETKPSRVYSQHEKDIMFDNEPVNIEGGEDAKTVNNESRITEKDLIELSTMGDTLPFRKPSTHQPVEKKPIIDDSIDAIDGEVVDTFTLSVEERAQELAKEMAKEMATTMAKEMATTMAKELAVEMRKEMAEEMSKKMAEEMAEIVSRETAKQVSKEIEKLHANAPSDVSQDEYTKLKIRNKQVETLMEYLLIELKKGRINYAEYELVCNSHAKELIAIGQGKL